VLEFIRYSSDTHQCHALFFVANTNGIWKGLDKPPFPGPKGQELFGNISKQAWQEWIAHQTMLINEKKLNMMDLTARAYLTEQRDRFLSGETFDQS
jgi:Fe-S cluster biosynthesis and repair protein YggX